MSSKVHGAQCVLVDLDRFGQCLVISPIALPRGMASFSTVMLFIHQMVPGAEGHQVSIVGWGRYGHRARAAHIGVTQLVGQNLQLIRREAIVIPKHVVVRRTACPLDAGMTAQVEVKLSWMSDFRVYGCTCWNVPTLPNPLILVCTEEACMVALLHYDECDPWLIVLLQLDTSLSDGQQLMMEDLLELALRNAISVEDDAGGLEAC